MTPQSQQAEPMRCGKCLEIYPADHWAIKRERCPACGGQLVRNRGRQLDNDFEHYDSSADIQFDLRDLLSSPKKKEKVNILVIGCVLVLMALASRLALAYLSGQQGMASVPIWFDILLALTLLVGVVMITWSAHRLWRHKKAMKR